MYCVSNLICSQHAIELILVSDEADLSDLSPMCISSKQKWFKCEQSSILQSREGIAALQRWMPSSPGQLLY